MVVATHYTDGGAHPMSTHHPATALGRFVGRIARLAVRALAFWLAIALAFVATALALLGTDPLTLATLLALDATALVVGRGHATAPPVP